MNSFCTPLFVSLLVSSCFFACSSSTTTPAGGSGNPDAGGNGDSGASSGDSGPGAGDSGTIPVSGATALTGTLGTLGAVKPTVSSLWISNSGETLIYMSSGALTCDQLKVSRWLGSTTAGSQVVEIVIKGAPKVGDYPVPPSEVNYAQGGKSSSYEVNADSGKISFTKADAQVVEGTVSATYGSNSITGTFHAEFCAGGQGF
jgi:hypothetical protein